MKKGIVLLLIVAVIGYIWYARRSDTSVISRSDFEMIAVDYGPVVQQVSASGKIQPINTVSVGTQVSGIIEKVLVDYNDEVTSGQLLAKLDTSVLQENKNDAEAQLELTKAKLKQQKVNYERYEKLYKDKLIAKADLEDAEVSLATAKAQELSAQAAYNKAEQNFGYASIISPVSGTVISKEIEEGQTVAASLQTPTLFKIAEDLSKMQIEANIAEADIGMIVANMPATFTVDAHPNDVFEGRVRQIRLSPTEEQNVVMYTVVIEVDNSSRKLLPGMTAFVNIKIKEVDNALRLPTTALQFKPNATVRQYIKAKAPNVAANQGLVYRLKKDEIVPVVFTRGISDISYVEVLDGLELGDEVIGEYIQKGAKKTVMSGAPSVIDVEHLNKTYFMAGGLKQDVLKDVSFTIGRGEFVAIMGPSGSGKSTLMNILGCLDRPTSGDYRLNGTSIAHKSDAEMAHIRNREIGFVFQNFNLLMKRTIADNVSLPLIYANVGTAERYRRAVEILHKVGLKGYEDRLPTQISGGMQQRVAIARALVNNPVLLFADEPTGNLDSKTSDEIMALFADLNKQGITIVLVTHEEDVASYAKRMIFVHDGRIDFDGSLVEFHKRGTK